MPTGDCGLVVFLRLPEKGKVKTRLASTTGDEKALQIYQALSDLTIEVALNSKLSVYLFYEGGLPAERHSSFQYQMQPEGDLGHKIESALIHTLQKHAKALIIGSDCPDIEAFDLQEASQLLDDNNFVIGPVSDGGFYLFGCRQPYPRGLFQNMPWSSPEIFRETINRINNLNATYSVLRLLRDIDTEEDWINYQSR